MWRTIVVGILMMAAGSTVARADHTKFFQFFGSGVNDHMGAIAGAGDVNRDGYDDIVVGAWGTLFPAGGYVRVYSGKDGALLHQWTGDLSFGRVVAGAGDVNRDGYDDIFIGGNDQVWVYSGRTGGLIWYF